MLFALCMRLLVLSVWSCLLHCCMLPLFVCFILVGKAISGPKLGWVIVILSAGRVIGRGWVVGLFYGFWSFSRASKILLGAMLELSFRWLLLENSL